MAEEVERNSEGAKVNWFALAMAIVAAVAMILEGIMDAGLLGPEGTAAVVVASALAVMKAVADYGKGRTALKVAKAAPARIVNLHPPTPPASPEG